MKKRSEENSFKTLDSEIQLVQMEKFINSFNSAIKKDIKNCLKKAVLGVGPLILSFYVFLIFNSSIILIVGLCITCISSFTISTRDFIRDLRSMIRVNSPSKEIKFGEEKDVEQILKEGIVKSKEEDFYSEKFKSAIEKFDAEDERKYREALKKQKKQIAENNPNLRIVENDIVFLDKNESIARIMDDIDTYFIIYNLPPLSITDNEWDLFFGATYDKFLEKGIESNFYDLMSRVVRFVFAKSLLSKKSYISIRDFVENLYYLEGQEFNKETINALQQEIISKLSPAETINLLDYVNRKRRK